MTVSTQDPFLTLDTGHTQFERDVLSRSLLDPVGTVQTRETKVGGRTADPLALVVVRGESLITASVHGCSIGTKYGCVQRKGDPECAQLPLGSNDAFDTLLDISPTTETLARILRHTPPLTIFPTIGLIFAVASSSICIATSGAVTFPRKDLINLSLSGLALAFFGFFAGLVLAICSTALGLETLTSGKLERGFVYPASISTAALSFVHFTVVLLEAVADND
ncbi:hypothetical protein FALBO_12940 [Fusarium albosuccineum]|uniref:Uncharacterized protein n=1 Tax=Fusarium albosuccineum TaxID=1237068 RepID=A0A8H4P2N9_9HYPO|nr:hypothetical protein FALBO_12940 [Fusarium albosuccineum]